MEKENRKLRQDTGPILVVALTNHALDQLLEGTLAFEQNIIRVGSRSELQEKTRPLHAAASSLPFNY